jgi:hypothetical protein
VEQEDAFLQLIEGLYPTESQLDRSARDALRLVGWVVGWSVGIYIYICMYLGGWLCMYGYVIWYMYI